MAPTMPTALLPPHDAHCLTAHRPVALRPDAPTAPGAPTGSTAPRRRYELALELIEAGGAYVCHQTGPEIKASRLVLRAWSGAKPAAEKQAATLPAAAVSPWRERRVAENRRLFEKMKAGRFAEGEAVLRMRGDLRSDNSALWDPAAYRVLFHAHPRTGGEWCIYPTYDYTHCVVDSLENVSHSLCTLEFEGRQARPRAAHALVS